ncbi:kinesin motor domain protein, partial [Ichthyophthirius multifiliis]
NQYKNIINNETSQSIKRFFFQIYYFQILIKGYKDLVQQNKKDLQSNKITDEELINELKVRNLPVYGTRQEKLDRIQINPNNNINQIQQNEQINNNNNEQLKKQAYKDPTVEKIQKMEKQREERRLKAEEQKRDRDNQILENQALGKNIDVDFDNMIKRNRFKDPLQQPHTPSSHLKLCVCVRKRPIFKKEEVNGEIDSVSVSNPQIRVLAPKLKVDGITKYIDNSDFTFDNTFNESEDTFSVYKYSLRPLLEHVLENGVITCFAYGQTGSGKTFTMKGIQEQFVNDLYKLIQHENYASKKGRFFISFFEIYGGRCYDLLNNKQQLIILEDKSGQIQIQNLFEKEATSAEQMISIIEFANNVRTQFFYIFFILILIYKSTHATEANDTSSRSHAICQIKIKNEKDIVKGQVILVDLAGSERAQDCQSNNRQRRIEGAEINKRYFFQINYYILFKYSLLALKECIRAMDMGANYIPFRASKLTLVLRDSFYSKQNSSKIVMIACICPNSSSAEHTLNTLRQCQIIQKFNYIKQRYADRLKENKNAVVKNDVIQQNLAQQHNLDKMLEEKGKDSRSDSNIGGENSNKKRIAQKIEEENLKQQQIKQQQQENNNKQIKRGQSTNIPTNNKQKLSNCASNNNNISKNNYSDEDLDSPKISKQVKDDVRCMKETLKMDDKNKMSNEFFDFHEKVNAILEEQEEIFATHMASIKEDAKLLTQESELISSVQGFGFMDFDIDVYVKKLDGVIKKKLKMYNLLQKKLDSFKNHLKEEEEISQKVKETFYF